MTKIAKTEDGRILFYCNGCENLHGVDNKWDFNGDFEKPTINPSILVTGTRHLTDEEYQAILSGKEIGDKSFVCHSFVRYGKIQYLSDSTHHLAGQAVDLIDEKSWFEEDLKLIKE